MKKIFLLVLFSSFSITLNAQNALEKQMKNKVDIVNNATSPAEIQGLNNDFAKIIGSGTTDWRAYYYAALAMVRHEMMLQKTGKTQGIGLVSASAEKYLTPVLKKQADNPEINILLAEIQLLRAIDSKNLSNIKAAENYLNKAEIKEKNNPRISFVRGEMIYFLPELNGKTKQDAAVFFLRANKDYSNFKKENNLSPDWGYAESKNFLKELN